MYWGDEWLLESLFGVIYLMTLRLQTDVSVLFLAVFISRSARCVVLFLNAKLVRAEIAVGTLARCVLNVFAAPAARNLCARCEKPILFL